MVGEKTLEQLVVEQLREGKKRDVLKSGGTITTISLLQQGQLRIEGIRQENPHSQEAYELGSRMRPLARKAMRFAFMNGDRGLLACASFYDALGVEWADSTAQSRASVLRQVATAMLGVSEPRINALVEAGVLESSDGMVSTESIAAHARFMSGKGYVADLADLMSFGFHAGTRIRKFPPSVTEPFFSSSRERLEGVYFIGHEVGVYHLAEEANLVKAVLASAVMNTWPPRSNTSDRFTLRINGFPPLMSGHQPQEGGLPRFVASTRYPYNRFQNGDTWEFPVASPHGRRGEHRDPNRYVPWVGYVPGVIGSVIDDPKSNRRLVSVVLGTGELKIFSYIPAEGTRPGPQAGT